MFTVRKWSDTNTRPYDVIATIDGVNYSQPGCIHSTEQYAQNHKESLEKAVTKDSIKFIQDNWIKEYTK